MANHPEHASVYLAKIECFKKINVKSSIDSSVTSLWTACLSFINNIVVKYGLVVQHKFGQKQILISVM